MVFGDEDTIQVIPTGDHRDMMLTQDGQLGYELLPGDRIGVSLSKEKSVNIILLPDRDYYDLLLEKFQWGQNVIE
jgi:NAD+ kinase